MRLSILLSVILALVVNVAVAQQLNVNYQTATDSAERVHYLVFTDGSHCKVIYPIRNHGDAMFRGNYNFSLAYQVLHDTDNFRLRFADDYLGIFQKYGSDQSLRCERDRGSHTTLQGLSGMRSLHQVEGRKLLYLIDNRHSDKTFSVLPLKEYLGRLVDLMYETNLHVDQQLIRLDAAQGYTHVTQYPEVNLATIIKSKETIK
jgi:hypothetical protein